MDALRDGASLTDSGMTSQIRDVKRYSVNDISFVQIDIRISKLPLHVLKIAVGVINDV